MTEKVKKEKDVLFPGEDRRKMIEDQLKTAVHKRDEYTTLIYKCQGALELLDSMNEEEND